MKIDLDAIIQIESSGNPAALNQRSGARGLCQITVICLKEWNNFNPNEKHVSTELYDPEINKKIAAWYLDVRIPSMLRAYGMPITVDMILAAYNWGIGNLRKSWGRDKMLLVLPEETAEYCQRYKDLTRGA